jgi:hypothetical protein
MDISLSVNLWRINGCHELLASLGFDLMEVGQDQVTLRTGKQANKRNCQFVLQALLALFGKYLLKITLKTLTNNLPFRHPRSSKKFGNRLS